MDVIIHSPAAQHPYGPELVPHLCIGAGGRGKEALHSIRCAASVWNGQALSPPPSPPLPRGRGVGHTTRMGGEVERGLRGEVANAMRGK